MLLIYTVSDLPNPTSTFSQMQLAYEKAFHSTRDMKWQLQQLKKCVPKGLHMFFNMHVDRGHQHMFLTWETR